MGKRRTESGAGWRWNFWAYNEFPELPDWMLSESDQRARSIKRSFQERGEYARKVDAATAKNPEWGIFLRLERFLHHDGSDDQFEYKATDEQRKDAKAVLQKAKKLKADARQIALFSLKVLNYLRPFWPFAESHNGVEVVFIGLEGRRAVANGPRRENFERFLQSLFESIERADCAHLVRDAIDDLKDKSWIERKLLPGLEISSQGRDAVAEHENSTVGDGVVVGRNRGLTAREVAFVCANGIADGRVLKKTWDKRRGFYPRAIGKRGQRHLYDPDELVRKALAEGDIRPSDIPRIRKDLGLKAQKPTATKPQPTAK